MIFSSFLSLKVEIIHVEMSILQFVCFFSRFSSIPLSIKLIVPHTCNKSILIRMKKVKSNHRAFEQSINSKQMRRVFVITCKTVLVLCMCARFSLLILRFAVNLFCNGFSH